MVQHFHGQLSGLIVEQKEELQRSSDCIRDCQQFIEIVGLNKEPGLVSITDTFLFMFDSMNEISTIIHV
jgi:hypothetical protein